MNEPAIQFIGALTITTLGLSVSAGVAWVLLRLFRARSPVLHRVVWLCVLAQGWLLWKIPLPLLPADSPNPWPGGIHSSSINAAGHIAATAPPNGDVRPANTSASEAILRHAGNNNTAAATPAPAQSGMQSRRLPFAALATLAWFAGIVIITARFAYRYWRFLRWVGQGRPAESTWSQPWQALLHEAGVKAAIPMVVRDAGPMLCRLPAGYRLVVPAELWASLSAAQRLAILQHELAHYLRGDVYKSLLARLLMLPHWFNPLGHIAVRRFDECAEWACDDAVGRKQPQAAALYARALLDLARRETAAAAFCPGAGGRCMSTRIRRLVNPSCKEDSVMKRISLLSSVAVLSLAGLIHVVAADQSKPPVKSPAIESADGADRDAPQGSAADGGFKIDVAYVDVNRIFKKFGEFEKQRHALQQEVEHASANMKGLAEKLRAASQENGGVDVSAAQEEIKRLHQQQVEEFRRKEAQLYDEVFNRVQSEVARYAQEQGIRVVRRLKPTAEERRQADGATFDAREVLQRINRDVIYQADERLDITDEILSRLNNQRPDNASSAAAP